MSKILQIGEGNFLRAFAENYIQDCGEKVTICQPRSNTKIINALKVQNNEYDIIIRGKYNGNIVEDCKHIDCIDECIDAVGEYEKLKQTFCSNDLKIVISNTTEAGIIFENNDKMENFTNITFPAKITTLLYERFCKEKSELIFLPCELIENNGLKLKECVKNYARLWNLGNDFESYIDVCEFCDTLVDRIVTGHIENGDDKCAVACEPYKSWVIKASEKAIKQIPFKDITYTHDIAQYRNRKVKILNGTHTMSALAGYLAGFNIVRDMMNDAIFINYINLGLQEIKATIDMPCDDFAKSVTERFNNPFIDHKLLDISLNSISKFKVRCLITILDYYKKFNKLPKILVFSLSALIAFYLKNSNRNYQINDDKAVIDFFENNPSVKEILANKNFWGLDLNSIDGLCEKVESNYTNILEKGITNAIQEVIDE